MHDDLTDIIPPSTPSRDRPGGVNGLWFIAITLSLFILVPAIVIGITRLTAKPRAEQPLVYADRDQWQPQELRPRVLEYDMFVAAETGRRYRKANFPLEPDDEAMLRQAVALVQQPGFFDDDDAFTQLTAWADDHPTQFYPAYLAAEWLRVNGRADEADQWRDQCFRRATGAIVQQLEYQDGTPAAGHTLPGVIIAYDRVIDGELDTSLRLVYPAPTADQLGRVYLPTFESVYRVANPSLPPGDQTGVYPPGLTLLPQQPTRLTPNWFSSPGRVGKLPDATLDRPAP